MPVNQITKNIGGDDVEFSEMAGLLDADIYAALVSSSQSPIAAVYGAVGDGVTDDTLALQNAATEIFGALKPTIYLNLGNDNDAVFLVSDTIINVDNKAVVITGSGTIKRADGWIVNTDGDSGNFDPIIRIQGAPSVEFSGKWRVDGNRGGQTYPATDSIVGRGTVPFRHNGDIEICPSLDNTTPSKDININFGGCENSYLNGLVLWQCENAKVQRTRFANITWNGISGAGAREINISGKNNFLRCGASDAFDSNSQQGDRAGIQFREFPIGKTQSTEGIPCIVTGEFANGGINEGLSIVNNDFVECGVESVYVRAGFSTIVNNNMSKNCGYKRLDDVGRYNPAHIWLEGGQYTAIGNKIYQTKVLAGDQRPDGMRVTSLVGDATPLYPANGTYFSQVNNNMIVSAKNKADGVSYGYFNYGIRTNGHGNYAGNTVDGTQDYSIWVQNLDSFVGDTLPAEFNADGCTLVNSDLGGNGNSGVIHITRFGTTTGEVKNISAKGVTLNQEMKVLEFNSNLSAFEKINISHGTGDTFSRYTQIGPIALSSALKQQDNHGLGEMPKKVDAILLCTSNNGGWQTGDECPVSNLIKLNSGEGIFHGTDATKVTTIVGSAAAPIVMLNRAGGSEGNTFVADLTKWELYYRCHV